MSSVLALVSKGEFEKAYGKSLTIGQVLPFAPALKDITDVRTESHGEGPDRRGVPMIRGVYAGSTNPS